MSAPSARRASPSHTPVPEFGRPASLRSGTPKSVDAEPGIREVVGAAVRAQIRGAGVPRTAAHPAIRARFWSGWVAGWRTSVIVALIPVVDPFPHIAAHIHYAIRACPCRVAAHCRRVAYTVSIEGTVGQVARWRRIAPRIYTRVARPRAAFSHSASVGSRLPSHLQKSSA